MGGDSGRERNINEKNICIRMLEERENDLKMKDYNDVWEYFKINDFKLMI